jgi:hypothetical protein
MRCPKASQFSYVLEHIKMGRNSWQEIKRDCVMKEKTS